MSLNVFDSTTRLSSFENYSFIKGSKEWELITKWGKENKDGWVSTPASYQSDLRISQNNFSLIYLKKSKGVVVSFIDKEGGSKQYIKSFKKEQFDFLYSYKKPLERINLKTFNTRDPLPLNHSFFIDTLKTSIFYKEILSWTPHKYATQDINYYLKELSLEKPIKTFDLEDFPRSWISLRQYKDELYLYNRSDGIDRRFGISDSSFIYYGPLESDADVIDSILINTKREVKLLLRTIEQKSKDRLAIISIKKTDTKYVWLLSYKTNEREWYELVTPKENILNFKMIVNYCPISKQIEYQNFDKINFDKYK